MSIVTGAIRSTPTYWPPILKQFPLPYLRRKHALEREFEKSTVVHELPMLEDLEVFNQQRLKVYKGPESQDLPCIIHKSPGSHLPRKIRILLN